MCREVSDNERLEHRLEELEQQVDISEAVQDFADEKMQERIDHLEEKVEELEEKFATAEVVQDFESKPQEEQPFEFYKKVHTDY